MMIGRLVQTALITISSGACLSQAPTFNNDLTKEPNQAITTSYEDLNTIYYKEQINSNTYNDNAISMEEPPNATWPKIVYMKSYYNARNINNAYMVKCKQYDWYELVSSTLVVNNYDQNELTILLEAKRAYYIEVETYYTQTELKIDTEFVNADRFIYNMTNDIEEEQKMIQTSSINTYLFSPTNDVISNRINNNNNISATDFTIYNETNKINWTSQNTQNSTLTNTQTGYPDEHTFEPIGMQTQQISIKNNQRQTYQIAIIAEYEIYMTWYSLNAYSTETLTVWDGTYLETTPYTALEDETVILEINYNTQSITTTPDIVDIPGLMFTIISLPFTFISQAFNLTIFPGTPYQINFSNILLIILTTLILLFIIRLIMRSRG